MRNYATISHDRTRDKKQGKKENKRNKGLEAGGLGGGFPEAPWNKSRRLTESKYRAFQQKHEATAQRPEETLIAWWLEAACLRNRGPTDTWRYFTKTYT